MTEIPTLHSERLILRAQRPDDSEALLAALTDDDFSRFITREGRGLSPEEASYEIAAAPESWAARGYGQFIVEERSSGAPVGQIGPCEPEGWPDFEIAYAIFPPHQGKGYAVEGAAATLIWAHETLGRNHVIHLIDPRNVASEHVAAALGGELTGHWSTPLGGKTRIWTTRWARFVETAAYHRQVAAAAERP